MAKKDLYYKIDRFSDYLKELRRKQETFELISTTYTKKIKKDNCNIIFNESGTSDYKTLCLINKVRKDGKDYKRNGGLTRSSYINFFNLIRYPDTKKIIHKIDIRGAYWNYSRKIKLVSEKTNDYFTEKFEGVPASRAKKSRLKALGSLATKKQFIQYIKGNPDYDTQILTVEKTREIYMEVCRGIDDIMKECALTVEGCVYYYYDCMFVNKNFSNEVIEFFKNREYDVKIGETRLEYITLGDAEFVLSMSDNIMYAVRREDKYLLNMN